jgi:hypothetical protein
MKPNIGYAVRDADDGLYFGKLCDGRGWAPVQFVDESGAPSGERL